MFLFIKSVNLYFENGNKCSPNFGEQVPAHGDQQTAVGEHHGTGGPPRDGHPVAGDAAETSVLPLHTAGEKVFNFVLFTFIYFYLILFGN